MVLGYQCKEPGCPVIVKNRRQRYCDKHKRLPENQGWQKTLETKRLPLYNTERWQRLRVMKLRSNPICEVCQKDGATAVHHIKPARLYPELQYSWDNLQSICHKCHAKESARESHTMKKLARGIG